MQISDIIDIVVGISASAAAIAAWRGLYVWREENKGKTDFDVARRLLISVFRLRDAIKEARNPWIDASEFPPDYRSQSATNQQQGEAWVHVFKGRWTPIREAASEMRALTVEAEALWGSNIRCQTDKLERVAVKLRTAMDAKIRNEAGGGQDFESDKRFSKMVHERLNEHADMPDDFSKEREDVIKEIEDLVRPHLRGKGRG